jgi:predicted polyphosphate/ATP-dependent NAD kinase
MRVGVVCNPVAGMGGRVGLKGTDGLVDEARRRGAEPRAPERAREALASLHEHAPDATVLTWGDPMGESAAREAGFDPTVLGRPPAETTAADTRTAVAAFCDADVDLVLFVGGDDTAVDVAAALADGVPLLGVPAGVKVYSAVFAVSPAAAGRVAATFERTERREVSDIDETAYRDGAVRTSTRAVVPIPVAEALQERKQTLGGSAEALESGLAAEADPGTTYVLGPGGTLATVKEALGFEGTPLGVDVYRDGAVLVRDGSAAEVQAALGERNVVVVSPIGGQGFVLGRGNDQLSPAVVRASDLRVVATREKLADTPVLRVDTGDPDLDESLRGWHRVRTGRVEHRLVRIV